MTPQELADNLKHRAKEARSRIDHTERNGGWYNGMRYAYEMAAVLIETELEQPWR